MTPSRPQLLTYPESLGGGLAGLADLLDGPLRGLFRGIHVLPPYPSSGDRGFAPRTYDEIDPRLGTWADISRLASSHEVMLDVMVNHISRQSPEFRDVEDRGMASPYADLFITPDKVWPGGRVPPEDLARIFLRRSAGPFSRITTRSGERLTVWTTFGEGEVSEQVDIDVFSVSGRRLIARWMAAFAARGVSVLRLDAVGYVVKKAGTACFMVEPEIWDFLDWARNTAAQFGLAVLPEVHDRAPTRDHFTARGYWTYDFVLPGLVLLAAETGETEGLARHLAESPRSQVTVLDCHDGVPVRPDLDGVVTADGMRRLVALTTRRGGNVNRVLQAAAEPGAVDAHQLNLTYYSALGEDDGRYLAARVLQLFAPGVPQVYYVGLLAGANDLDAVARTGEGRAINRHDFTLAEVHEALGRPVVQELLGLIRLRNTHPAFGGDFTVRREGPRLRLTWTWGEAVCEALIDFAAGRYAVSATGTTLAGLATT
ncbi:MAG: sucrose phosphorylase [Candidatus Limnocylindrales bacterium]